MGNVESGPGEEPGTEDNPLKISEKRHRAEDIVDWGNPDWAPGDYNDWAHRNQENNGDFRNTTPPQDDKSASIGLHDEIEQESYEEVETDPEEDSAYMSDNGTQSLMGASAAVFQYLELAEQRQQAEFLRQQHSEDLSVSECSAAVFRLLEAEAVRGNTKPLVKFLETASVVSQVLLEDANSVSDASAAVFRVLEKKRSEHIRQNHGPPTTVINLWGDDAQSVQSVSADSAISGHSSAVVSKVLDDTKTVGTKSISEFSNDVFKLLDKAKSVDSLSTSQKSAAIFNLLDEMQLASPTNASTLAHKNVRRPLYENLSCMPRIAEEQREQQHLLDVQTYKSTYSATAQEEREDYPEVGLNFSHDENSYERKTKDPPPIGLNFSHDDKSYERSMNDPPPPEAKSTSNLSEDDPTEGIDLLFVENFDRAFNAFIAHHPKLLLSNPDLGHHIRVSKLQKLFEFMDLRERQLLHEMESARTAKIDMEKDLHLKLREASRKKAARQINLQNDLQKLVLSTKEMEATMGWKFVDSCESRSKKQLLLRQKIRATHPPAFTRQKLLQQIPEGHESEKLWNAVNWPPNPVESYSLSIEQENELRKFQVDNAFKASELSVLKNQLTASRAKAKKQAWVEPVLLRIDGTTMSKLRAKFLKKLGVSSKRI